jgi:hypothetical protein
MAAFESTRVRSTYQGHSTFSVIHLRFVFRDLLFSRSVASTLAFEDNEQPLAEQLPTKRSRSDVLGYFDVIKFHIKGTCI